MHKFVLETNAFSRENDLRPIASADCVVRVRCAQEYVIPRDYFDTDIHANSSGNSPICSTWLGGSRFANNHEELSKVAITRQEYQEYGSGWAGRRFAGTV